MNWQKFQTHNESNTRAFEAFCNQIFEKYCYREFSNGIKDLVIVNGSGGDGGVESYAEFKDTTFIGLQAKWFPDAITDNQFRQIKTSIETALKLRQNIKKYIVCVPRDLGNIKMGRGKKPIENPEYSKWSNIVENFKKDYPNLKLILWGDNEILNQLQTPECYHLRRYWFEVSDFDYNVLIESFNREKGSWLKYKYSPDLHIEGQISKELDDYIGINKQKVLNHLNTIENKYLYILEIFGEVNQWCNVSDKLNNTLEQISKTVKENISTLKNNKILITQEINNHIIENIKQIDFATLLEEFAECNSCSNSYYRKLEKIIKNYDYISFDNVQKTRQLLLYQHILWIIGAPGTGKTHGVAGVIDKYLQEKYNIPIFITAKNIDNNASWKDILIKSLNLANTWSENEILSALESLCIFNEINNTLSCNQKTYKAKIIICIDGLDEIKPYDFWINKINEANVIGENHPRIKFVFTSRHNVAELIDIKDDLNRNIFYIYEDGDTPTYQLFESYIRAYNIQVENPELIKWFLRTPLSLKLFCELFKNQRINGVQNKLYTITSLIQQKLKNIEKEFCKTYQKFSESNNIIFNTLSILSDYFIQNPTIYENKLVEILLNNENLSLLEKKDVIIILDFLENNGFLQRYIERSKKLLSPNTVFYMKGIQPFFDYILAVCLIEKYDNPFDSEFFQTEIESDDCLSIYAALLLEKKKILISDIPYFRENMYCDSLVRLDFFALVNNAIEISKEYKDWVLKFMGHNASCLIMTLNKLILPVARIPNHPLGGILLHEFLSKFELPMQRDLIWSIQKWLRDSEGQKWDCKITSEFHPKVYQLTSKDIFNGLPLIYAWSLTNIDNIAREEFRKELMKWALLSPNEFLKLFELTYKTTNDPQMKEELLAIAMGLSYSKDEDIDVLQYFKDFIFKEIFNSSKNLSINNIAIRQYARCISQHLFAKNLISKDELLLCIPPFQNNRNLQIDIEGTKGSRMSGFKPITYDLSRYVLCDNISRLFFEKGYKQDNNKFPEYYNDFKEEEIENILNEYPELNPSDKEKLIILKKYLTEERKKYEDIRVVINRQLSDEEIDVANKHIDEVINSKSQEANPYEYYNDEAIKLLKQVSKDLDVDYIRSDQFVLAGAYAYLKQNGWNKDTESADIGIKSFYYPSSHGSKSKIMTLCEKYIWCFKHVIYGFLSDIIAPRNDYNIDKIDDYSLLVSDLINPAQEMFNVNIEEEMISQEWYTPENLSPEIPNIEKSRDGIIKWIKNAPIPNFENWIEVRNYKPLLETDKQWLCLYSYNSIKEPHLKTQTFLFLNSLIISKELFPIFLKDVETNRQELCQDLFNCNDMYSQTLSDCYITPKEICQMSWKINCYEKLSYRTISNNKIDEYKLIKCIEQCTANYANGQDVYYELPSKYIRDLLGISDGNGITYTNNNEIIAKYFNIGKAWEEKQEFLCIDKSLILEKLNKKNEMLVWVIKVIREPSYICREKYKDLHIYKDSAWIVWFDETSLEWKQYCFIEAINTQ